MTCLRRPHVPRDPDIREIFQIAGINLPGNMWQIKDHAYHIAFMHAGVRDGGEEDGESSSSDVSESVGALST